MRFKMNPITGQLDMVPDSIVIAVTPVIGGTTGSVLFVGPGPVVQQDNAHFFWDDTNNRLGIGTASPSARLHVAGAVSLSENSLQITTTHTGSFVNVVNINPQKTGFDATYFSCLGFEPQLNTDASVTVSDLWGITGNPRLLGASNATRAVAFRGNIQHTSSGILTNAYAFLVQGITKTTGQLLNAYGLYVTDLASVGSTSNWAVFTAGTTPSNFGGPVATLSLATGAITASSVTLSTGGALRTATGAGNTALLQAYDVDGAAYTTFATLTANNTPTMALSNVTSSTNFNPTTDDAGALGTTALMWSDLCLASGSIINWNNGDVTLTHSADTLTLTGGRLVVTTSSLASGISVSGTALSTAGIVVTSGHTASFTAGISCNPSRTGTNTGWFAGLTFEAFLNTDTSVTVSDVWGVTGNSRIAGASNVSNAVGNRATVQHTSSGTSTNAISFLAGGITKSTGAITNAYSFYGVDLAGVAATNNFHLYLLGAGTPSYIQGKLQIGQFAVTPQGSLSIVQNVVTTGTPYCIYIDPAAHTTLANADMADFAIDGNRIAQFATGNRALQQQIRIKARTYSAVAASTYDDAATVSIDNASIAGTNVTLTRTHALWVKAGATRMDGRMLNKQGADVASANDLTLGEDGNAFAITGTTQINAITTARWQDGCVIQLVFVSTPTVKHNTAGGAGTKPILLAGAADFVATADDTLTLLLCTQGGTQAWREIAHAVI